MCPILKSCWSANIHKLSSTILVGFHGLKLWKYSDRSGFFFNSGGSFPFTVGRIEHGFNVRPDLCACDNKVKPTKYLGQIYTDSLVHDKRAMELLIDVIGKVGTVFLQLKKKRMNQMNCWSKL